MEQKSKVNQTGATKNKKERKKKIELVKKERTRVNRIIVLGDSKREPYRIIENQIECTPQPLHDKKYHAIEDYMTSAVETLCRSDSSHTLTASVTQLSMVQSSKPSLRSRSAFSQDMESELSVPSSVQKIEDPSAINVPSMFRLRDDPPPKILPVPRIILIRLKETNTFFFLDLQSTSTDRSLVDAAEDIQIANDTYENTKKRQKKISYVQTQTKSMMYVTKTKYAFIDRATRANSYAFAAAWDIFDCYKALEEEDTFEEESFKSRQISNVTVVDTAPESYELYEQNKILTSITFSNNAMCMERVLVSGNMSEKQHVFRGLLAPNPYSVRLFEFNYRLELLVTLKTEESKGMTVNAISWNCKNSGIVAVGYGKYEYNEQKSGLICCWNIKNLLNPERRYYFPTPVTSLCFSSQHPHVLVAAFYDGLVIMLNVNCREVVLMGRSKPDFFSSYEPVWQVCWFPKEDNPGRENPVSCGQSGKIVRYMKDGIITAICILPIIKMEGRIKGIKMTKTCHSEDISLSQCPAALCIAINPNSPLLYIVGTDEGCIYHCSVILNHQHLSMTLAHNGPVYKVQYHPFCPNLFLSAGGDWCIRVWAVGVFEPLITLISGMQAVLDASWSPSNSTVIASITGTYIEIWDICRKTYTPVSSTCSPSNSQNTKLMFTNGGLNLTIGDRNGNVFIFAMAEMPCAPLNQRYAILFAIKKSLASRPQLLIELRKVGEPFDIL